MDAIERENPTLRDVLPKVFARGNLGHLINRRTKEFSEEDAKAIADTYHAWRVLTPGCHVGLPDENSRSASGR